LILVEEAPGGTVRWIQEVAIQIGDRLRWLPAEGGARLVVRRLDPDGASLDRYNPTAHWKVELKESELVSRLQQRVSLRGVAGIELEHNDQGRVLKMTVRDDRSHAHVFTGMRIRGALGLKDNVFRFLTVGKGAQRRWLFYGRGWGHGVGMDQTGAYGMALEGATFDQILKHYYTGIELTKAY
jgi:stage II sporulation protein D